jgi:hypothetical protein
MISESFFKKETSDATCRGCRAGAGRRLFCRFVIGLSLLIAFACAEKKVLTVPEPGPSIPGTPVPAPGVPEAPPAQKPVPRPPDAARTKASEALVQEARRLLNQGEADAAIRILERSVALDASHGQSYFYLAEAWLMKTVPFRARQFNSLAELHLKQDPQWAIRIARQRDRIDEMEK